MERGTCLPWMLQKRRPARSVSSMNVAIEASAADWITTTAAAARLEVTPQTVRRMVKRGQLPAQRLENGYHGRMLLARTDVEALAEKRATPEGVTR